MLLVYYRIIKNKFVLFVFNKSSKYKSLHAMPTYFKMKRQCKILDMFEINSFIITIFAIILGTIITLLLLPLLLL